MNTLPDKEFALWPDGAPGALGTEPKDIPTLIPFWASPEKSTGACIVVFPGGGYQMLAEHEGKGYADFFVQHGITCFVLKYRLASDGYQHPAMLWDAARAVRLVRSKAREWNLDPARIGIIGSSAGGHLASTLVTHFDAGNPVATDPIERESSRPDLGILCYPVISMGEHTHGGSAQNLLGENPGQDRLEELSNELQVTANTPSCFIWHTWEDPVVVVENSLLFATALRKCGVLFDLHVYERGNHGIGLSKGLLPGSLHPWTEDCIFWLNEHGFAKSNTP